MRAQERLEESATVGILYTSNPSVFVVHPHDGPVDIQKHMMVTVDGRPWEVYCQTFDLKPHELQRTVFASSAIVRRIQR